MRDMVVYAQKPAKATAAGSFCLAHPLTPALSLNGEGVDRACVKGAEG